MKKIVLAFLVLFSVVNLSAQHVLKGKVLDKANGKPLYLVKVTYANQLVFTNKAGEFELQTPKIKDELTFAKEGFITKNELIEVHSIKTISLRRLINEDSTIANQQLDYLDELMVTAPKVEHQALSGSVSGVATTRRILGVKKSGRIYQPSQPQHQYNASEYSKSEESGFKAVSLQPLSTFSIDVDVASYAITRRHINNGMLPPQNSVRVEEMINYFNYEYPKPKNGDPLAISLSASGCPWNDNNFLLRVGLQSKEIRRDRLPRSNFVFLIDISGSMSAQDKLPLAKAALKTFLSTLREDDKVSIVTYAGSTRVALESTPVKHKKEILHALKNLNSGGSTAGAEGLKLAYDQAERAYIDEGNNRIIMVTDGDFNVGPSSVRDLKKLVKSKRDKGINISILGFGQGNLKDNRMETIADNGNGNYAYVDNLQEAQRVLMKEFASNLFVVAKDIKVQIEFNPALVASYRLVGYDNRALAAEDFNNDKKDAGEMGANQQVTALYEISMINSDGKPVVDPLRYSTQTKAQNDFADEIGTVKIRYKNPKSKVSNLIVTRIDNDLLERGNVDEDFRMTVAVAMFGQLLRGSDYIEKGDMSTVANLIANKRGQDEDGYKAEFMRLVQLASNL